MTKKIAEILELYKNGGITSDEGLTMIESAILLAEETEYRQFIRSVKNKLDKGWLVNDILKHVMPYMSATKLGMGRGHNDAYNEIEKSLKENISIDETLKRMETERRQRIISQGLLKG